MARSEPAMMNLGKRVAAALDDTPTAAERADVRARLVAADIPIAAPRSPRRRLGWAGVLIAATLAAAALVFFYFTPPRSPIAFFVGEGAPGEVGASIASPSAAETPIRFSDGSTVRLRAGGRARVGAVEIDGAEIALERGAIDLEVVHRDRTRWRVQAGPFVVHVVGTRFETAWDPAAQRFSVALREGAITVDGPVVGVGRVVRAGERITVMVEQGSLIVASLDAPVSEAPKLREEAAPPLDPANEAPPKPSAVAPRPAESVAPAIQAPASWRTLAIDLHYSEALAAAEREGFGSLTRSLGAGDLRLLGDAARLAPSDARAREAYGALLDRFRGSADGGYAVYMLGRIAHQAGDGSGASTWFERYLEEQPGGPFAEEAAGRLLEIADDGGDRARARQSAKRYLATHPSGPRAPRARNIIARDDR